MPDPFPRGYDRAFARLRVDLERIHDPSCTWKSEAESASSGIVIPERRLGIGKTRTKTPPLDLDPRICRVVDPAHQQISMRAAIFQDIATKFRSHRREHRYLCCPK